MDANFAGLQIDLLIDAFHDADLQIEDPVRAERIDQRSCPGIELHKAIPRRDVDHPLVAFAVGPVRHTTARQLPRRDRGALAFAQAVRPDQLAGFRVERDDRSPRAGGRVEHAFDHQRRALQLEFGKRPEAVGLEAPRNFQRVEVGRVDLVERRIPGGLQVGSVRPPLAVLGRRLALS